MQARTSPEVHDFGELRIIYFVAVLFGCGGGEVAVDVDEAVARPDEDGA
jgi:hypothetical protein